MSANTLRLTIRAVGDHAVGHATGDSMVEAAQTTRAHGHTHFKLRDIALSNTSHAVGSALDVGVTVIMLDRPESGAFAVDEVLARRR